MEARAAGMGDTRHPLRNLQRDSGKGVQGMKNSYALDIGRLHVGFMPRSSLWYTAFYINTNSAPYIIFCKLLIAWRRKPPIRLYPGIVFDRTTEQGRLHDEFEGILDGSGDSGSFHDVIRAAITASSIDYIKQVLETIERDNAY